MDTSSRDGKERATAEGQARNFDAWCRELVARVPAILYADASDEVGSTVYVSPQVNEILGYTPEEWCNDPGLWSKALHPDDRERTIEAKAHKRRIGEPFGVEYRLLTPDGHIVWVRDEVAPVCEEENRHWQGILLDITERKRYEQELKESEERFWLTFKEAKVGMAHVFPDGRWLKTNDKFCELLGYEYEELLDLTFQDIIHSEDQTTSLERISRLLLGKTEPYTIERSCARPGRSHIWVALSVFPLRDATSGESKYFVCMAEEITNRKLAELLPEPLTHREKEVLTRVASAHTNGQIADNLHCSFGSVKLDVRRILAKLKVENRTEAAKVAIDIGLIPPPR